MSTLSTLLMELGRSGVELAAEPADRQRIRYRPATLPAALAARLKAHKSAILRLLVALPGLDEDGAYVFEERLGIAELLGLPTHPGSPAWAIAVAEAEAEPHPAVADETVNRLRDDARAVALIVKEALGVPVRAHIAGPGTRFPGEPDWAPIPKSRTLGGPDGSCYLCEGRRWWRLPGQSVWTCAACHPPAPSFTVDRSGA